MENAQNRAWPKYPGRDGVGNQALAEQVGEQLAKAEGPWTTTTVEDLLDQKIRGLAMEIHQVVALRKRLPYQILNWHTSDIRELNQYL